jgi:hypothetical protein
MKPDPHVPQCCLLTKVFDDLSVTEKQGPVKEINLGASLSLKEIFKNVLR